MSYNPDSQRLFFDDLINARDLGGMPLANGNSFRKRILLRSGSPSLASEKAIALLKEFGLKTVIDLRSEAEVQNYGNPFKDDDEVEFYNYSLFLGNPDSDEDPTMIFLRTHKLGDFYVMVMEELGEQIVRILKKILDSSDGITLFHCAHGKDRTGIIAAILYLIAGASNEDIISNYKVSYNYAKHFLDPLIAVREDAMKHTLRSDKENMEILLNYISDKYNGDISNYLIIKGMNKDDIDSLRKIITE